jgi:hypothetical protein
VQADELLPRSVVLVAPTSLSARPASFRPGIELLGETARVLVEQVGAIDAGGLATWWFIKVTLLRAAACPPHTHRACGPEGPTRRGAAGKVPERERTALAKAVPTGSTWGTMVA